MLGFVCPGLTGTCAGGGGSDPPPPSWLVGVRPLLCFWGRQMFSFSVTILGYPPPCLEGGGGGVPTYPEIELCRGVGHVDCQLDPPVTVKEIFSFPSACAVRELPGFKWATEEVPPPPARCPGPPDARVEPPPPCRHLRGGGLPGGSEGRPGPGAAGPQPGWPLRGVA